jgi:hypothetical protein
MSRFTVHILLCPGPGAGCNRLSETPVHQYPAQPDIHPRIAAGQAFAGVRQALSLFVNKASC